MYWAITIQEMITNIKTNVNKYIWTALFPNSFLISRIKIWYDRVYRYKKWSWNIVTEKKTETVATTTFTLDKYPQNIFKFFDWDNNEYVQVVMFSWKHREFIINWKDIEISEAQTTIKVFYRRYATKIDPTKLDTELDVPPEFESIIESIAISKILHIWLWEWVSQMASNYNTEVEKWLLDLAKMDSYNDTIKTMISPRIWPSWRI